MAIKNGQYRVELQKLLTNKGDNSSKPNKTDTYRGMAEIMMNNENQYEP